MKTTIKLQSVSQLKLPDTKYIMDVLSVNKIPKQSVRDMVFEPKHLLVRFSIEVDGYLPVDYILRAYEDFREDRPNAKMFIHPEESGELLVEIRF